MELNFNIEKILGIGDWGLGIGDWAQSPIPNPQSPIPIFTIKILKLVILINKHILHILNFITSIYLC